MIWLTLFSLMKAEVCNPGLNDERDSINPECNYAGICFDVGYGIGTMCICCDSSADDDFCAGVIPGVWEGDNCEKATYFTQGTWGYLFEGGDITCANDAVSAASPNLLDQTVALMEDHYDGEILSLPCEVCTTETPCSFFTEEPEANSGIFVKFGTDFNTYYDRSCSINKLPDTIGLCDANWDYGASAFLSLMAALDEENSYDQLKTDLEAILMSDGANGLGWPSSTYTRVWHQHVEKLSQTVQTTRLPTPSPTPEPTSSPTSAPTLIGDDTERYCKEYINSINDLKFLSAGSSCRGNIKESWTGGRTCASPYIVCLPGENNPGNDIMGNPYKSNTYRYSVAECLQECSYDQRCLGIEFVADTNSVLGDCNLIDDIPIAAENEMLGYVYSEADASLDVGTTGGNALCWAKVDYCNPYFEAEDLNDVMLNCYCPNNRKGFYTKKVKRIVNNTRYCYDDLSVEQRIKKAQANRMFHLCENWCLFNTINPDQESWYWDPWKTCWRETYSGTGKHDAYCDRVIRNPDSIELKFVNERSENFLTCGASVHPTSAPISDTATWILSVEGESCDEACSSQGKQCAEETTAKRFESETELINAFSEAGHTCESSQVRMETTKFEGWALPGLRNSNLCVNRLPTLSHLESLDTDCSRKLGGSWQRLCACF